MTAAPVLEGEPGARDPGVHPGRWTQARARLIELVLLAASAVAAGGLILPLVLTLPRQLQASTSLIGYPTFTDFNINRYFIGYRLVAYGFPLLTLAAFAGRTIHPGVVPAAADLQNVAHDRHLELPALLIHPGEPHRFWLAK